MRDWDAAGWRTGHRRCTVTREKNISSSPGVELTAEATAVSPCTTESGNCASVISTWNAVFVLFYIRGRQCWQKLCLCELQNHNTIFRFLHLTSCVIRWFLFYFEGFLHVCLFLLWSFCTYSLWLLRVICLRSCGLSPFPCVNQALLCSLLCVNGAFVLLFILFDFKNYWIMFWTLLITWSLYIFNTRNLLCLSPQFSDPVS